MNITNANRKKALLLHYAGEDVHDMFSALTLAPHVGEGVDPSACTLNGGICGNDAIGIVFCNVFLLISFGHRRMGF
jgi:hypothetical protein